MPVQVMPDDHSKLVPPLPIPNRTVKQLCADDSAATSVKVGYRQACYLERQPSAVTPGKNPASNGGVFFRLLLLFPGFIAKDSVDVRSNSMIDAVAAAWPAPTWCSCRCICPWMDGHKRAPRVFHALLFGQFDGDMA